MKGLEVTLMAVVMLDGARKTSAETAAPGGSEEKPEISLDALGAMVEEYARHVESILDPRSNPQRLEYAYSRLLGVRGNLCRICPRGETADLPRRLVRRWEWAETNLRAHLEHDGKMEDLCAVARKVEEGWADSIERYVMTLTTRLPEADISDKIGILKGIDTVGMHLAQREVFELSQTLSIPTENASAVKLRVRLLALFLTLHRSGFTPAYPAIQSYRRTFRIIDPVAYPWWFVDRRLTERQLNWTYRRMPVEDLGWRF